MKIKRSGIAIIGAGAIGTALGNVIAEAGRHPVLLHTIEPQIAADINSTRINTRYFPALRLADKLSATTNNSDLRNCRVIFLAIPSVVMIDHLRTLSHDIPEDALLINLAKGFGNTGQTIADCLKNNFANPVCTLKGPSFAREIINRMPTGFTLGYPETITQGVEIRELVSDLIAGTNLYLDYSTDIRGVEILSILKNIYAVVLGIVDAHFNSPNLRFMILTKAFREMRNVLLWYGGREETLFNYCGFGDFTLTALNDLSRNRTLGLLIGKGFFTEHVSHELVLEGKTAVNIFHREISAQADIGEKFPLMAELHKIFNDNYDISEFVDRILKLKEY